MKLVAAAAIAATTLAIGGDMRRAKPAEPVEAAGPIELRVAPDGGAPIRASLAEGDRVTVAVRQGNWSLLRAGEKWGWAVKPELRTPTEPPKP